MNLSIITINYNNLSGLRKTVESVFAQTYDDFEYIIVDGASTDGSQEYLEEVRQQREPLLKNLQIISEPDTGIYNAMNKGIRMASGEYLQFLNSGDYLLEPTTLEDVFARQSTADVVYGNRIDVYDTGETEARRVPHQITAFFLRNSMISHQASFIRRTLFEKVGMYREDLKYASDWEFFLKAFVQHNATSEYMDKYVVYFDRGGISSNPANREEMLAERKSVFSETLPYLVTDFEQMETYIQKLRLYDHRANELGKKILLVPRKIYRWFHKKC